MILFIIVVVVVVAVTSAAEAFICDIYKHIHMDSQSVKEVVFL